MPTGHIKTRAKVIFSIKPKPGLPRYTEFRMQAVTWFGSAREITPTRIIKTTIQNYTAACAFKKDRCSGQPHCLFCKLPIFRSTWLCGF